MMKPAHSSFLVAFRLATREIIYEREFPAGQRRDALDALDALERRHRDDPGVAVTLFAAASRADLVRTHSSRFG